MERIVKFRKIVLPLTLVSVVLMAYLMSQKSEYTYIAWVFANVSLIAFLSTELFGPVAQTRSKINRLFASLFLVFSLTVLIHAVYYFSRVDFL